MTKRDISLVLCVAVMTACLTMLVHAQATTNGAETADVAGTWSYTVQGRNGQITTTITLEQDGNTVTGTVTGFGGQDNPIEDGMVTGNTVTFKTTGGGGGGGQGASVVNMYTCTLEGDTLAGKVETIRTREFEATRGG